MEAEVMAKFGEVTPKAVTVIEPEPVKVADAFEVEAQKDAEDQQEAETEEEPVKKEPALDIAGIFNMSN